MLTRWSIAAGIFGGVRNLSCVILSYYQEYCSQHIQPDWDCLQCIEPDWAKLILPTAISLAPSLVLFALHDLWPVVLIYASMLFSILVWRVEYPHEYYALRKFDEPGVLLVFLGMISMAVALAWATIRLSVFTRRVFMSNRAEQ